VCAVPGQLQRRHSRRGVRRVRSSAASSKRCALSVPPPRCRYFLRRGFCVVFLHRTKSLQPFEVRQDLAAVAGSCVLTLSPCLQRKLPEGGPCSLLELSSTGDVGVRLGCTELAGFSFSSQFCWFLFTWCGCFLAGFDAYRLHPLAGHQVAPALRPAAKDTLSEIAETGALAGVCAFLQHSASCVPLRIVRHVCYGCCNAI